MPFLPPKKQHQSTEGISYRQTYIYTYIYPFNGPFSETTQVSQYQKGKTNLDFTEATAKDIQTNVRETQSG